MKKSYEILESKLMYSGRTVDLVEERVKLGEDLITTHTTVKHKGAVVILPKMDDGQLIILKQYRHSIQEKILEFPAGTLGVGEEPIACALREICEETGYGAKEMVSLGTIFPAPGFCNEIQHFFFATDLYPKKLAGDEDEIIEILTMSALQIEDAIKGGLIQDGKSIAIYFKAKLMGLV